MNPVRPTIIDQLDERLERFRRRAPLKPPLGGWIHAIRTALGMTSRQFASRLGVAQQTALLFEKSEKAGTIALATLRKAGDALDCDVHYFLVPRKPLREKVRAQAQAVAERDMGRVQHTMDLEGQSVEPRAGGRDVERHVDELLRGRWSRLWR